MWATEDVNDGFQNVRWEGERGYWDGIVGQFQPTPGASQRKDTAEVATQDRKGRHSRMSLPEPDGAIGETHSGRVRDVDRDDGVVDTPLEK